MTSEINARLKQRFDAVALAKSHGDALTKEQVDLIVGASLDEDLKDRPRWSFEMSGERGVDINIRCVDCGEHAEFVWSDYELAITWEIDHMKVHDPKARR